MTRRACHGVAAGHQAMAVVLDSPGGLEGIASKRLKSPYRSGRSPDWLKFKNVRCRKTRGRRGLA